MVELSSARLDRVFHALSDATRRDMLRRLAGGEHTVSELAEPFHMSLAAASKHIRTLEEAGLMNDTIVLRLADHGEGGLSHGMREKAYTVYEEMIHIPLIVHNPKLYPEPLETDAFYDHLERRVDEDLDESTGSAGVFDHAAHLCPRVAVGAHKRANDGPAMAHDLCRDEAYPAHVLVTVLARETKSARQVRAHDVAVEGCDNTAGLLEQRDHGVGRRGLAGAGQTGEPQAEPAS